MNFTVLNAMQIQAGIFEHDRSNDSNTSSCEVPVTIWAESYSNLGALLTITVICTIISVIIFGNTLTIVAVLKERRLRQVQNWFVVSLACADLLVGLLIMPLTLAYEVLGRWALGAFLCELWLALDVLFVTSSILNICVISLDRYWSVTDPLNYGRERTSKRVLFMIASAWVIALLISFPPLVGWRPDRSDPLVCDLSTRIDYVLYSALGSFYVPSLILTLAYFRIYQITRLRASRLRKASSKAISHKNRSRDSRGTRLPRKDNSDKNGLSTSDHDCIDDYPLELTMTMSTPPDSPYRALSALAVVAFRRGITGGAIPVGILPAQLGPPSATQDTDHSGGATDNMDGPASSTQTLKTLFPNATSSRSIASSKPPTTTNNNQLSLKQLLFKKAMSSASRRLAIRRREIRATAVLGLILLGFIVCWLPFFLIYVLNAVCCSAPELVFDVCFWLGYCNSALNPLIYAAVNMEFRRAFQKLLRRRRWRRNARKSLYQTVDQKA